ncbi:unnamed protein product, partial [Adineta ricciae]
MGLSTVVNTTDPLMSHEAYAPNNPTNGYEFDDDDGIDNGASITVRSATMAIMKFAMSVNLDKSHTVKLLKLVKSILPHANILSTSHHSVLKLFGRTSAFTSKYVCDKCGNDIGEGSSSIKGCFNSNCPYFNQNLMNNRFTEIVTMDKQELTLILHVDGAPLVRSSQQNLWPLIANIVEIPPPYQCCSLSAKKTLMEHGTTIVINDQEFIADSPAKLLFLKTINFNGNYACTWCHSR